jgi:hypothetical protein
VFIPDTKTATKEKREKIWCPAFFSGNKYYKIKHYFNFDLVNKKIRANLQTIVVLFPKQLSLSSEKNGFGIRDPRSGKNPFRIPDLGVKNASDPGSGSAHPHCNLILRFDAIHSRHQRRRDMR